MTYIGIDLGTTFSAVAYIGGDGEPRTMTNAEGQLTTPSAVLFDSETDIVVGREARLTAMVEPEKVAICAKRYMGRQHYPDPINGVKYSPVAISAMILRKLKTDAETQVGEVSGAVITVPAYFDETRRRATALAAQLAEIDVLAIINEPTAAAICYAYSQVKAEYADTPDILQSLQFSEPRISLVYDLGGGTFDVTIIKMSGTRVEVIGTDGDVQLGGRDWDQRLVDHFARVFKEEHGTDPREDPSAEQQLYQTAEEVKKTLSSRDSARFMVNHAGHRSSGKISRLEFESMTSDLLFRTENRVETVCENARLNWNAVDDIITVGGSTRMPQVINMLTRVTGKAPYTGLSPDEAVAHGAAIYAGVMLLGDSELVVTEDPQQSEPEEEVITRSRARRHRAKETMVKKLGNKLTTLLSSFDTVDVSPHSLGLVTYNRDGQRGVSRLIRRNSPLPATKHGSFGTQSENQTRISVEIVEGESPNADECHVIGTCIIRRLPRDLPKGSPVKISFSYDTNGCLHCQAVHIPSGMWAETTIQRRGGIDPEKIKMDRNLLSRLTIT